MSAEDFIAMIGENNSFPEDAAFSIQAYLEKWTDRGWLQCLDWLGNPSASNEEIESQLNEMFRSFIVGNPVKKPMETEPPEPPENHHPSKPIKFNIVDGGKSDDVQKSKDSDIDWI